MFYDVSDMSSLKKMFYLEIEEYNSLFDKKRTLTNEIAILEGIGTVLENDSLTYEDIFGVYMMLDGMIDPRVNDSIYSNLFRGVYSREFDEILSDKQKEKAYNAVLRTTFFIDSILSERKIQFNKTLTSINNDFKHMKTCQFIIACLNNNGFIGKEIDKTFMDVLVKCGIDPVKAAGIKEQINIHHLQTKNKTVNYDVYNVLNDRIENIDISEVDIEEFAERDANLIKSIMSSLNSYGFSQTAPIIDQILSDDMSIREYDYIMNTIINNVVNTMLDYKGDLANSELYTDNEMKSFIVMEYNNQKFLLRSLKYYTELKREQLVEIAKAKEEQIVEEVQDLPEPVNKLIFIDSGTGTALEKDMKLLPAELLGSVEELLTDLEFGVITKDNTTVFRGTNKKLQYFREMRGDQTRILYRKLRDNYYEVLGVFQKEADNDIKNYYNIVSRFRNVDVDPQLIEQSDEIRKRISATIEENKRIGNRYN